MNNPFRFGGTLGPDEIVDREGEINQVAQTIRDGEKLFLIGPRRYGKTTVLHAARQLGESKGMKVLYFNAEAYPTLGDLTARIFSSRRTRRSPSSKRAARKARD